MNDPSYGVAQNLVGHMHLISSFQFPIRAAYGPENALKNLLEAPRIVKDMGPVAWHFIPPPQDGQVFLTWQPPRLKNSFASDGYIWADPEASFHQELSGYTLEMCVHRAGYAYGRDTSPVATHMRTRYHIINKSPNVQGPAFEPSLWIVHYGPNDPNSRIPIDRIQVPIPVQHILRERQMIEQQGQLTRKDFMLHDRTNWPTITLQQRAAVPQHPNAAYAASQMQMQHQMAARQQQHLYQPQIAAPPAKRARTTGNAALQNAVINNVPHDRIVDDEEYAALGDYLDHLTPAEISKVRYKQHHEWMEEIFSSTYSISQIVPEELGLGLTGELKTLTDGIFTSPIPKDVLKPAPSKEPQSKPQEIPSRPYEKLAPEKMEEFETRLSNYTKKAEEEIEAMKKEHAQVVNEFKRSRTYMLSERRLREVSQHGPDEGAVDAIVKEVQSTLNVVIDPRQDVVQVEKGGLEEEDKSRSNGRTAPANGAGNFGGEDNSAANLLDQFGSGSYANTPVGHIPTPHISASQSSGAPTPGATAGSNLGYMQQQDETPVPDQEHDDTGMDLIEGMDLDVDLGDLEDPSTEGKGPEEDWVMVDDSANANPATTGAAPNASTATADPPSAELHKQPLQAEQINPDQSAVAPAQPSSTIAAETEHAPATEADTTPGATDLFADTDFNSFDNLDTAGDALADFDTGGDGDDLGLDLGDDTFNEAFQAGADDDDPGPDLRAFRAGDTPEDEDEVFQAGDMLEGERT